MQTFSSARDAKEYLVAEIVAEAEREGVSLSETERKMMYFSESSWTLPDMSEVNEAFERDYDPSQYEAKIGGLVRNFRAHIRKTNRGGLDIWKEAVRILRREDHYLLVLIDAPSETAAGSTDSRLVDRLKLVATALAIVFVILAVTFFFTWR
jgi:hypothetical protein